ncbi:MAG: PKD domain containing protein [Bacteroidetes bacterium RBG_13_43_22]|nr:MAG: PKD domain containing protein [Bacteroidetes bacterium RBG_13_43_22]
MKTSMRLLIIFKLIFLPVISYSQVDSIFKIFQFPADKIPRIDGNPDDWEIVPDSYIIGSDQLKDDEKKHSVPDPKNLDVKVKVGWVDGINKLYFLYEAYDDYWDFSRPDLHHDIFEIVVDGDQSGGPLIEQFHPNPVLNNSWDAYFNFHGVHAQNYHIYTPAENQDWCLAWGSQPWIKELPWSNAAYSYNFRPGESGKLVLEFWITPFDYAGHEGALRAVESVLKEGKNIGLCWAIIDFDDVNSKSNNGFWNLSDKHTMYGNASQLRTFKLMPLEPVFRKKINAKWSFKVIDMNKRLVAFQDESIGKITSWKWDFGDGTASAEQHPIHAYSKAGRYIVTLFIEGTDGQSHWSKVWDVAVRSDTLDYGVKSN